jgi:hypothetical protein
MTAKDVIASCLVIALGIILVLHFALFWVYGGVYIYESNKVILLLETIMSIAILGFGVERLLASAKVRDKGEARGFHHEMRQRQASTEYATSPSFLQAGKRAATPTATAATMMPGMTTLQIDSSADYMEHCSFNIADCTPDGERELTAHTEAV